MRDTDRWRCIILCSLHTRVSLVSTASVPTPAAAQQFDVAALFWLGTAHHVGNEEAGIPRDGRAAMRNLELAAGQGHPGAQIYLARLLRDGDRAIRLPANRAASRHFFDMAVASGEPEALYELADDTLHGRNGHAVDHAKALELYEQAGASGHADALVSAGAMHAQGLGTPQNYRRAFELYQAAAERNHYAAWENVAAMHAAGQGVPVNEQAARFIREKILPALDAARREAAAADAAVVEEATLLSPDDPASATEACPSTTASADASAGAPRIVVHKAPALGSSSSSGASVGGGSGGGGGGGCGKSTCACKGGSSSR